MSETETAASPPAQAGQHFDFSQNSFPASFPSTSSSFPPTSFPPTIQIPEVKSEPYDLTKLSAPAPAYTNIYQSLFR